ncbi:MAG: DUF1134 domain-containing protein [Janthinobacterium lividum]
MTSIPMNSVYRRAIPVLLASALAWATPAAAARDPGAPGRPSGTVSLQAKAAAVGVGFTWGDGILTFNGHRYPFEVKGITVADVGFSRLSGRGRVYNLKKVEDFSGTYAASTGEATLGRGLAGQVLVNSAGVQLRIDNVTRGARLSGSADGIQLTLK